jgi:acyl carrier protein
MTDDTERRLRALVAEVTGLDPAAVADLPAATPLLVGPLGLGSRGGARLLLAVRERFGVDVAAEDLALMSLESLETLATFVRSRRSGPPMIHG